MESKTECCNSLQKFKNEREVDDQIVLSLGEGFKDEIPMLFQMGQGHFTDKFMEAADYLLERSYPEIVDGTQVGPICIPETFLPDRYYRGVDPENHEEKLKQLRLDDKEEREQRSAFKGEHAERIFYDEIKKVLKDKKSKAFVIQGSHLPTPEDPSQYQESDFIVINGERKYFLSMEIKCKLSSIGKEVEKTSVGKGIKQIGKIKNILETFFCSNVDMRDWKFVGALGYVTMADHVKCCPKCKPFVVKSTQIKALFNKLDYVSSIVTIIGIDKEFAKKAENETYKLIIRNLLFTILANPGPIVRSKIDEETFKKIQEQGDCCNILFWTPSQYDLMQLEENDSNSHQSKAMGTDDFFGSDVSKDYSPRYKHVLFNSSYSTGKTEVIKAMMKKLMVKGQKVHFIFCVDELVDKKPILLMQLENEFGQAKFKDNIKFSWVKDKDLQSAVTKYPDHHVFVDEYILDLKKNGPGQISQIINQLKISTKVK